MTRTEDRLADALSASARTLREDTLRPPVIPSPGRRWSRWLAPAGAAGAAALVVVLVAALAGQSPASKPATVAAGPPPRYYVDISFYNHAVVRSTATGAVTATVPIRSAGNVGDGLVAAAANGTFFVAAFISDSREQIYHFGLNAAGHISGFAPVPGGRFSSGINAMAASPDGSRLAVTVNTLTGTTKTADEIVVIDVRTGGHSVWQGGLAKPGYNGFDINSLSWTADQHLVFAAQWCWPLSLNAQACGSAESGRRRAAEVWEISTAPPGGRLDSGRLLLRQSARYPYIAAALISPDGGTLTALVMHGPPQRQGLGLGMVPSHLAVVQITAVTGRQLRVLYRRPLGPTGVWTLSQDGAGAHWLLDGAATYGGGGGLRKLSKQGYNGWISAGRLIPLKPATGYQPGEAW
jgi:hypothetical protein